MHDTPPPSLVSASCILTTPLDVADDQSGTLQSRTYTCMERASEDHIQHATCPNHELLEIASKCCEDKISKCGVPEVCQDSTKFMPEAVSRWLCVITSTEDICPTLCHRMDSYQHEDGTTRYSCVCHGFSDAECRARFPGDMAHPTGHQECTKPLSFVSEPHAC